MGMSSDVPDPPNPAKRPKRNETVEPEDIVTEDEDQEEGRGRKALRRPVRNSGGNNGSGANGSGVGTGLSA